MYRGVIMRRIDQGRRALRHCRHAASVPVLAAALLAGTAAAATPQSYTVYNIPSRSFIPCVSSAPNQVLNDAGQVCGSSYAPQEGARGVVYDSASNTLKELGVPAGRLQAAPNAINGPGQVTGDLVGADGQIGAFLYDGSTTNDLASVGLANAETYLINSAGQIFGQDYQADGSYRAYRYNAGGILALASANNSLPIDANDAGSVAGYFWTVSPGIGSQRCFLDSGTNLTVFGDASTIAACVPAAINQNGQVSGYLLTTDLKQHAFRYANGTLTDLGTLPSPYTEQSLAVGIAASGAVAGNSVSTSNINLHAFFHDGTTMRDLGTLGGISSTAIAMNANAQIVGNSVTASGASHAFTWSPSDNALIDLNSRIPSSLGIVLDTAIAISGSGNILAQGNTGWVLLKPNAPPNSPPVLGPIVANDPVPLGSGVTATVRFTDADVGDTHSASWNFDVATARGTITEPNGATPGSATASFTFTASGVYDVSVTVSDSGGNSSTVPGQVVVYDPNGGFVTGGGWIMSPPGAYKAQPNMSGRASFGFTSKYLKGATKPSGQTEFQFQTANLNFHSSDYDWLVVGGARAQYKGTGTINGSGSYKFLLTAVDGDLLAAGTPDRFRIRIWHHDDPSNTDVVDYDNQVDSGAEGGNLEGTAIGGGSISIKTK
jgi:probable HAF family extracellular repeat protein